MNKFKNFFVKLWNWIKKVYITIANFFKENVWAGVLGIVAAILIFILIVQGVVKGIDKCKNGTAESKVVNRATVITSSQVMEKLNNGDTFILFIGSASCAHCKQFYPTVNKYVDSGHTIYYLDIDDTSDLALKSNLPELIDRLLSDIPKDRGITELATPTTIYIENGEFADAIQGAYGMEGGTNYATFCDIVEGKYVGKPAYKLQ